MSVVNINEQAIELNLDN